MEGPRLRQAASEFAGLELPAVAATPENAAQLGPLAVWGIGRLDSAAYSPDGRLLAIDTGSGLRLYDAGTLNPRLFLPAKSLGQVSFSPDGRLLATGWGYGDPDRQVRIWRLDDGAALLALEGHSDTILRIAFSPDGKVLATGSQDGTARLWRVEDGALLHTCGGHKKGVDLLAFSPDGALLATVGWWSDKEVRVWRAADGALAYTLPVGKDGTLAVSFLPGPTAEDPALIATREWKTVRLWSAAAGAPLHSLAATNEEGIVQDSACSPDGSLVSVVRSSEKGLQLWRAADGQLLFTLAGHDGEAAKVAFAPGGRVLASAGKDGTARLWDVTTGRELRTLEGHSGSLRNLTFAPDGDQLVTVGDYDDKTLHIWSVDDGALLHTLDGFASKVNDVKFSPDGRCLAVAGGAGDERLVRLVSVPDGATLLTLDGAGPGEGKPVYRPVNALAFAPDGGILAAGSGYWGVDNTVRLWRVADGKLLQTLEGARREAQAVAFSPDGRLLAVSEGVTDSATGARFVASLFTDAEQAGELLQPLAPTAVDGARLAPGAFDPATWGAGRHIWLWSVQDGRVAGVLGGHDRAIYDLAWSPDGANLASASTDGTVRVWQIASATCLQTVPVPDKGALSVAYSPDGAMLAVGPRSGAKPFLWNLSKQIKFRNLEVASKYACGDLNSLAFSPDGRLLAGAGNGVFVWSIPEGKLLFSGHHAAEVYALDWSPDGKLLASCSWDGTVRLWGLTTGAS